MSTCCKMRHKFSHEHIANNDHNVYNITALKHGMIQTQQATFLLRCVKLQKDGQVTKSKKIVRLT